MIMTPDRWIILVAGGALVAFIVWFFWLKRAKGVRASETSNGYQEAMVLAEGEGTPDTIIVRHGKPIRINFRREETVACSVKVIFSNFNKGADLPSGETVPIEIIPSAPEEYDFFCAMGMFRGKLIVQ
tara:strand:+ start:411 stop:794 length:384 start_codon:yes stop_codon:yes gene_type:complete